MKAIVLAVFVFLIPFPSHGAKERVFKQVTKLAITVDDLPAVGPLPSGMDRVRLAKKMIKIFQKHGVPEVYGFVNGAKLEKDASLAKVLEAWSQYSPLGNHTYDHGDLSELSTQDYIANIDKNEEVLKQFLRNSKKYKVFRYPHLKEGETLEKFRDIRRHLAEKKYSIAEVTMDFGDWAWNAPYVRCLENDNRPKILWLKDLYLKHALYNFNRGRSLSKILYGRNANQILLLHIGAFTVEMLDELLTSFEKEGVRYISLREAMEDSIYLENPDSVSEGGQTYFNAVFSARKLERPSGRDVPEEELGNACH